MKVVLLNTYDKKGGAAIACDRLNQAHIQNGIESNKFVLHKAPETYSGVTVHKSIFPDKINKNYEHLIEKLVFRPHEASKEIRFAFSLGLHGKNLKKFEIIQDADIIHLHWINNGFLSLRSIDYLLSLNKPIVWTMHDMWPFTGGCHYAGDCNHYEGTCGQCHFLKKPEAEDISNKIWNKKKELFQNASNLTFVGCSRWLSDLAKTGSLLQDQSVVNIPNCIDTNTYKPHFKSIGTKYVLLFQAMNINEERKGLTYLIDCLRILREKYPEVKNKIKLLIFGEIRSDEFLLDLDYEVELLGSLTNQEDIIKAYQKANIFITPSLQDNLPNTVMESLACGIPVLGFETGGIPEMVDHKINGYIAPHKDSEGLAEGLKWIIGERERYLELCQNARKKVLENYTYNQISAKYLKLYQSLLN